MSVLTIELCAALRTNKTKRYLVVTHLQANKLVLLDLHAYLSYLLRIGYASEGLSRSIGTLVDSGTYQYRTGKLVRIRRHPY